MAVRDERLLSNPSARGQSDLRDELCEIVMRELKARRVGLVEAAAACMGAAAVVLAVLPPPAREAAALEMEGSLLRSANQRAKELRSGEFDDRLAKRRQ